MPNKLRIVIFCFAAFFYLAAGTYKASHFSHDFIPLYSSSRCLIHDCDPYDATALSQQYIAGHGIRKLLTDTLWAEHPSVYPPSTFIVISPFALLPFRVAAILWALLSGSALIAAMVLVLSLASGSASPGGLWAATLLTVLMLLSGGYDVLAGGNPATISCAFAVIGSAFFLIDRWVPAGALLLTLSLAVKPQIAGLVILYLLVRGVRRNWAALSLGGGAVALLLGVLILQMHPGSQHWLATLRANLAEATLPGHSNDPSPLNTRQGMINLQTLTSIFLTSPRAYNAAALGLIAVLFVCWIVSLRKMEGHSPKHFFALPPLLILSLFPVYHRAYDDLLLVVSIPMIVALIQTHRFFGGVLTFVTALPFLPMLASPASPKQIALIEGSRTLTGAFSSKAGFILSMRPGTVELLVLFCLQLGAMWALADYSGTWEPRLALELWPTATALRGPTDIVA